MTTMQLKRNLLLLQAIIAIAIIAQAQTATAGRIYLGETFNYSGGTLSGLGAADANGGTSVLGDNFVNDWTADGPSTLDFSVQDSAVLFDISSGAGSSSSYSGSVSRDFSIESRDSYTFAATLTQKGSQSSGYSTTVGFGGTRIGIENGQFVAELGGQKQLIGQVSADTPYNIVGRVEYGDSFGERLTLWVNNTYQELNEQGASHALATLESAGGSGLGNSFSISAEASLDYTQSFSNNRIFVDDLFVGSYFNSVNSNRYDIGGGSLQTGYEAWDVSNGTSISSTRRENGIGDLTFTLGGNNLVGFDSGAASGIAGSLTQDGVKATGELLLQLTDASGIGNETILKSYLSDPFGDADVVDIYLTTDGPEQYVMSVDPSNFVDLPAHASMYFTTVDGDALIRFATQSGGDIYLSGFELVPEPSTYALMIMGMFGMGGFGFWQKRKQNKKS